MKRLLGLGLGVLAALWLVPAQGQPVTFHVQPDDVFAFHPETGNRLVG
jgi:hypothetical protein